MSVPAFIVALDVVEEVDIPERMGTFRYTAFYDTNGFAEQRCINSLTTPRGSYSGSGAS